MTSNEGSHFSYKNLKYSVCTRTGCFGSHPVTLVLCIKLITFVCELFGSDKVSKNKKQNFQITNEVSKEVKYNTVRFTKSSTLNKRFCCQGYYLL